MRRAKVFCVLALLLAFFPGPAPVAADEPRPIPPEQFDKLHKMIRPQPGEVRFHEVPWLLSIWETRKQAAAEGKPILVWSGSGGAPIGSC